jgi:hypothetical protein
VIPLEAGWVSPVGAWACPSRPKQIQPVEKLVEVKTSFKVPTGEDRSVGSAGAVFSSLSPCVLTSYAIHGILTRELSREAVEFFHFEFCTLRGLALSIGGPIFAGFQRVEQESAERKY